ncbi:hypothetical protein [Shewanella benthica]|nr:hypothetical protein [Shewanella benthica]
MFIWNGIIVSVNGVGRQSMGLISRVKTNKLDAPSLHVQLAIEIKQP